MSSCTVISMGMVLRRTLIWCLVAACGIVLHVAARRPAPYPVLLPKWKASYAMPQSTIGQCVAVVHSSELPVSCSQCTCPASMLNAPCLPNSNHTSGLVFGACASPACSLRLSFSKDCSLLQTLQPHTRLRLDHQRALFLGGARVPHQRALCVHACLSSLVLTG